MCVIGFKFLPLREETIDLNCYILFENGVVDCCHLIVVDCCHLIVVDCCHLIVLDFFPWRYNPHWGLYFTAL